jgi:hypothetical protein
LLDRSPADSPASTVSPAIYPGEAELRGGQFLLARALRFLADRLRWWRGASNWWAWKLFCEARLRVLRPDVLVTFSAGFHLEEAILVDCARALGTKVVVLPLSFGTVAFNQRAMVALRRDYSERIVAGSWLAVQIARFAPQYAFQDDAGALIFYAPVSETISAMLLGLNARAFYCRAGDTVDLVCSPSQIDSEELAREGVPPEVLRNTGSPVFDQIHQRLHTSPNLEELPNFDPNASTVVINFTPLATYGLRTEAEDEQILEELLVGTRAVYSGNIVVSVHPGPFPEMIHRLAASYRGSATQTVDVTVLIQRACLYLSERSTTIHFAIALGVPVVVLGFTELIRSAELWRAIGEQYRQQGTILVSTVEDFRAVTSNLLSRPAELQRLKEEAKIAAPRWALLDGKCCERIASELKHLCAQAA